MSEDTGTHEGAGLVTVAYCRGPGELQPVRVALEEAGLEVLVVGEYAAGMFGHSLLGPRVQVPAEQRERARAVLLEHDFAGVRVVDAAPHGAPPAIEPRMGTGTKVMLVLLLVALVVLLILLP